MKVHYASGFENNRQLFDRTSWITEKNHHTDQTRTEYRNRYNKEKPFHKVTNRNSFGRLEPKERFKVYDSIDNNPNTNWERKSRFKSHMRNAKVT